MRSFQKKMLKTPHFWVFWAKKADFGPFLAKKGQFSNFRWKSENVSFLLIFFFIFQYKKSENSNARIFGKMGTNVHTDRRTEANPKVHRLRQETKNQTIPMNQSEEKWEKPHFLWDWEVLKGIKGLIQKSAWNIFVYPCST